MNKKIFLIFALLCGCCFSAQANDWAGWWTQGWTTNTDTDWDRANAWRPQSEPTAAVDADIPGAETPYDNYVEVDSDNACNNLTITDNMSLRVYGNNVDLDVSSDIYIEAGSSLIVGNGSTNVTLTCSGSMDNDGTFSYNMGGGSSGTVDFDGTGETIDMDGSGGTGTGSFYNLTISGSITLASDVTVDNNLSVASGATLNLGSYTLTVKGATSITGTLNVQTGTLLCEGSLTTNAGGVLNNNSGIIRIESTITNSGTYNYNTGTFAYAGTGQTVVALNYYSLDIEGTVTAVTSTPNIYNDLTIKNGGSLNIGSSTVSFDNGTDFIVDSGGVFISSAGTLQSQGAGEYFSLTVNGTINVSGLTISYPDDNGLTVNNGASVSQLNNVTFQNGDGTGNRYLYLGHAAGNYTFESHSFANTCVTNVTAPNGVLVNMVNAAGTYQGESYDGAIDANIVWSTANTWQGDDATNPTLWSVAENWSKGTVPVTSDVVVIPNVTNDPILNTDGVCASIRIENGGLLTLSTAGTTLDVGGGVTIQTGGALTLNNATTTLKVDGIWSNSGTFTATNGEVVFSNTLVDQDIPSETFDDLTIDKGSRTATATGNITVNGDFKISGGTFDAGNATHTIAGTTEVFGDLELVSGSDLTATGALTVKDGGQMFLNNTCYLRLGASLTVDSGATGGKFYAGGSTAPTITNNGSGTYAFTVNGGIQVDILNFNNPDANGMTINNGAVINGLDNIDFNNGLGTTVYLRVLDVSATTYFFNNHNFDGNCANTVEAAAGSVSINMVNATGGGEATDIDPGEPTDNINWYDEKLWDGWGGGGWGAGTSVYDWSDATGWSDGAVPVNTDMVAIPTSAASTCTVDIGGAVAQGVRIEKELRITSAGDALNVGGYFDIDSGGSFVMSNGDLYVSGNWTNDGTSNISGGEVTFDGTTIVDKIAAAAGTQSFYDLTVSGTMTITDGDSVTVNHTFDPTGGTINAGDNTTLTTTGNWIDIPDTFNYDTSTVVLQDSGSTMNMPAVTYYNLTIDGDVQLASNITVKNDLTINSGAQLNLSSYTITVEGDIDNQGTIDLDSGILQVYDGFSSSGTFTADTGTVQFLGGTQISPAVTYYNLTAAGSELSLAGNTTVNNQFNINAGTFSLESNTLTLSSAAMTVSAGGAFTSQGGTIQSSGAGDYFSIDINGTINVDGLTLTRPDNDGLTIASSATIESLDGVTYNSGQNGASSRYLWIGHAAGTYTLVNHTIDANCVYNVMAPNGAVVYMVNSAGAKGGETNGEANDGSIDANIIWTAANSWIGGDSAGPTLWSVDANWSQGHAPLSTEVALITSQPNDPSLDVNGVCGGIIIENGATLTMATASTTLDVEGSVKIASGGTLVMSSSTTELQLTGNWTNSGTFTATDGTVTFDSTSDSQSIPAETFYNLKVDKSGQTASLSGNVFVSGDLTVSSGTLSVGAYNLQTSGTGSVSGTLSLTASSDVKFNDALSVASGGTVSMSGSCHLRLGDSLTVASGGVFSASGTTPTLTWNSVTRYSFTVSGEIDVSGLIIDRPDTNGLTINSGATITALGGVQFTNGSLSAGTYLRILLTDSATYYCDNHSFDNNCLYNVYVPDVANSPTINMIGASGAKNGESYDNDPGDNVNWLTQKIWYGSTDSSWDDDSNWSGNAEPVAADNVLVRQAVNPCHFDKSSAVTVQTIKVENNAILRVSDAGSSALTITSYLTIDSGGTLVLRNDRQLNVAGSWTNNGTFTLGSTTTSGTVVFNGTTTVNKNTSGAGTETFDNLTVSGTMTIADNDSVTVTGTFNPSGTVNAGNNTTLTTTGNWSSTPTFDAGSSTVVLQGTVTVPDVDYYNLTIADGSSTATLPAGSTVNVANDLVINSGNTLDLSNATLNVTGDLTINGTLNVNTGALNVSGDIILNGTALNGSGGSIDANGSVTITAGTLTGPSGGFTIAKNFSNADTFTHNSGSVIFDSADTSVISGQSTFYDFSCTTAGKQITFTAGAGNETTVANSLTLQGIEGTPLVLRSSASADAYLTLQAGKTQTIEYVDVQYNNASNGDTLVAGGTSTNSGNNTNWTFTVLSVILRTQDDSADYTVWDLGEVDLDSENIMTAVQAVLVKNDGNVAEDFSISASAANWTLSDLNGADTCVLMGLFNGDAAPLAADFLTANDLVDGTTVWATQNAGNGKYEGANDGDNVASGSGEKLYIYLETPVTESTHAQEVITITIGCRAH